mgnify:CR=1 FL=1
MGKVKEKIRVSTGKVREKGNQWEETISRADAYLENAKKEIGQLTGGFYCEAVLQLQKALDELAEESGQRIRELGIHVEKLQDIAANYEEAEKENELVTADH